ncbi:MAG: NADH-quinone oxidoreductase subunit K [Anaerolineales bacterium]|nr:NADH-quinone oxidoreductase subunit K [Anaerolineales bacterium]
MSFTPITLVVLCVTGVFGVGIYGLLAARNLIKMIVVLQIMVKAALLGLVAAGNRSGEMVEAQSLALTVIVVDTVVAVVGLALAVQVKNRTGSLDIQELSGLKG